jgi:hypothetical protein
MARFACRCVAERCAPRSQGCEAHPCGNALVQRLSRCCAEIAKVLIGEASRELSGEHLDTIELRAEARRRRAGKGIRLIVGGGRAAKPDRQMIVLLRNVYATRDALMSGRDAIIDALAQRHGVKRDYLSAHMRLTYLALGIA